MRCTTAMSIWLNTCYFMCRRPLACMCSATSDTTTICSARQEALTLLSLCFVSQHYHLLLCNLFSFLHRSPCEDDISSPFFSFNYIKSPSTQTFCASFTGYSHNWQPLLLRGLRVYRFITTYVLHLWCHSENLNFRVFASRQAWFPPHRVGFNLPPFNYHLITIGKSVYRCFSSLLTERVKGEWRKYWGNRSINFWVLHFLFPLLCSCQIFPCKMLLLQ